MVIIIVKEIVIPVEVMIKVIETVTIILVIILIIMSNFYHNYGICYII